MVFLWFSGALFIYFCYSIYVFQLFDIDPSISKVDYLALGGLGCLILWPLILTVGLARIVYSKFFAGVKE